MADLVTRLAAELGHDFSDPDLLQRALTHASAVHRASNAYERLEFLGDRVLGLVVAEFLLERYPRENEGQIARRHTGLVRQEALVDVARSINLGGYLIVSEAESDGGVRERESILSDVMEAVLAALYLDGGLEVARRFILKHWIPLADVERKPPKDAKTSLQEWAQGRGLDLPKYKMVEQSGPPHAPEFIIEVSVPGYEGSALASGNSKRGAEQSAAEKLMAEIKGDHHG